MGGEWEGCCGINGVTAGNGTTGTAISEFTDTIK